MRAVIQDIVRDHFDAYSQARRLPLRIHKAARNITVCRTAELGGHVLKCPQDHVRRIRYNSCKHRSCPTCSFLPTERWIHSQRARLPACDYYHVVFTMPWQLHDLWEHNRREVTTLFFHAAWGSLKELLADPKYLGALPGAIAAFQSWSQTLWLHPHLHVLVTGGGLTPDGRWVAARESFLLPGRVLRDKFRGKFIAFLHRAVDADALTLPGGMTVGHAHARLGKLMRTNWHLKIMPPYAHGHGVLAYLGRYIRGGPISHRRVARVGRDTVRVSYKTPDRARVERVTLPAQQFVGRLLRHVPPKGAHHIRSYGLFASRCRDRLDLARLQLGQLPVEDSPQPTWQDICARAGPLHPERCPVCGSLLVLLPLVVPGPSPPDRRVA
ncbi:MAG: IS91 family transposase [Planctomycetota bacterium]|jgi:hypothetical protein